MNTNTETHQTLNESIDELILASGSAASQVLTEDGEPVAVATVEVDVAPGTEAQAAAEAPTFDEFGIAEPICAALRAAGITKAFPIQALTLPIALGGHDVIGQARTGTGKTFAFGVPLLQHILSGGVRTPSAPRGLVVVPTRELAIQVAEDLRSAAAQSGVNVVTLYGGRAYEPQIEALATVDVVVGTPGRLLDLSRQGQLDLSGVDVLVLDEADRMLDLGFLPDVEAILRLTPVDRQTMLFSATMPSEVVTLAKRHLYRPMHIRAEGRDEPAHVPTTDQHVFRAHHLDKVEVLARVLQASNRGLTIVFCRTRRACDQVTTDLTGRGFAAAAVHGDLGQSQRERALRAFRGGKVDVLVATDVAARGLDVEDVTHVVNYECPEDEKAYLHRIGRTGRAGRTGVAVTLVDWQDLQRWKLIDAALNLGHPEPPETYSTSEHLFSQLAIPAGVTGALPSVQRGRAGLEAEDLEDIGETGKKRSPRTSQKHKASRSRAGSGSGGTRADDGPASSGPRSGQAGSSGGGAKRSRRRTRGGAPVQTTGTGAACSPAATDSAATSSQADDASPSADGAPARVNGQQTRGADCGDAQAAGAGTATKSGAPRKRRRRTHATSRGPNGVYADAQHNSTRPANRAELRDIAGDLSASA